MEKQDEGLSQGEGEKYPLSVQQSNAESQNNRLGHAQIPQRALTASCKGLMNWINQFILSQVISSFPADVISSNGSQLYEAINYYAVHF